MIILYSLLFLYAVWIFYLAVMTLKRARDEDKLSKVSKVLGYPVLFVGLLGDFIGNMLCTFIFLDLPQETLITGRMKRYVYGKDGWRKSLALWVADHLLDDFDPSGKHV